MNLRQLSVTRHRDPRTKTDRCRTGPGPRKIGGPWIPDEAPILSIALDPHADLIASSSCDGTFRVFRLADQSEVHKEKLWEKSSDVKYAKCPGTVLIEPENGELFAVLCSDSIRDRFQNSKHHTKVGCSINLKLVSELYHVTISLYFTR